MMIAVPFRIQRLTALVAGQQYAVAPPIHCSSVTISNRTTGALRIETLQDGTEYGIVGSCFEERIDLAQIGATVAQFRPDSTPFWLRSDVGSDTDHPVILTWTP